MACVLSDSPTLDADYQGATNSNFTVTATASQGLAGISAASYGSKTLTAAPFTFQIAAGVTSLSFIVDGSALNSVIAVQEVCPAGGSKLLRQIQLTDPNHVVGGVRIKGI